MKKIIGVTIPALLCGVFLGAPTSAFDPVRAATVFTNLAKDTQISVRNSVPWLPNTTYETSQILNVLDRFYLVTFGGTTGNVAPSHITGVSTNGTLAVVPIPFDDEYQKALMGTLRKLFEKINL